MCGWVRVPRVIGVVGRAAAANAAKPVPRPDEGFLFGEESSRWKEEEGGMERKLNWILDVSSHPPFYHRFQSHAKKGRLAHG